jgi:restriction system protein
VLALLFLIPAPFAAYYRHSRKKLLETHTDLESIRNLHWLDFEKLVAEAFSRVGYTVTAGPGSSSAGEINLVATAANEKILVQCKHWRAAMVGLSAVGDLLEMIAAEGATGGAVVTSGTFSEDAEAFATGKSIQLIDGLQLEKLVRSVVKAPGSRLGGRPTRAARD